MQQSPFCNAVVFILQNDVAFGSPKFWKNHFTIGFGWKTWERSQSKNQILKLVYKLKYLETFNATVLRVLVGSSFLVKFHTMDMEWRSLYRKGLQLT